MLSKHALPLILATVPVLRENGTAITRHFYQRMFEHNPELKNLFNLGNQASGDQAQALAGAIYAFAANLDKPAVLEPILERIAHKHVSLGITPAQYTIVGRHLLAAIAEVLGAAITPDILAAWDEAYWLMATDLIAREARLFQQTNWHAGQDWRSLKVVGKEAASSDSVAIYLQAPDRGALPAYVPGQYLSLALDLPEMGLTQIRQYSFSDAPGTNTWRVTVKQVEADGSKPAGRVSSHIHNIIQVGDQIRVGPPAGDFKLNVDSERELVLISAGVGITPMLSMLQHIVRNQPQRPVCFAYATTRRERYPHQAEVEASLGQLDSGRYYLWLEDPLGADLAQEHTYQGRMDLDRIAALTPDADYYLCGPLPFMRAQRAWLLAHGIHQQQIHYEVFGPDLFGELH